MRGAGEYAAYVNAGNRYAKDPFRWLRDRGWEDWQTPATRPVGLRGGQADAAQAIIDDLRNEAGR